ncbi:hypothetical protein CYMTET_23071 [Cymbomonas tetramitiformis]|uniref:Amino acid transporter transmembrane domain-containing protein n=1 Tax=Cymbomonas tetramitiformis TaxID=36881 RepID=A0AAE0L1A9_9CHLO|nr:hypothetical protein CYMTET_23071 [Cymbomonas tetramitiformis]
MYGNPWYRAVLCESELWSCIANLTMTAVGAVVLALPQCLADTGWALGVFLLFFFAYLSDRSLVFLVRCGDYVREDDYEKLAERLIGAKGKWLFRVSLCLLLFAALCSLLIIIGDMVCGPAASFTRCTVR